MTISTDGFAQLFKTLGSLDLFGTANPKVAYPLPPKVDAVTKVVLKGDQKMPHLFHEAYVAPLLQGLPKIVPDIDPANDDDLTMLETITGSVYQHADNAIAPELGRFLAVVSDLYRSFLSKKRRIAAGFPVLETLPPLAMFQHRGAAGPFTLPCDAIQRMFGSTIGVVSLPAVYAQHPFLWGSLCHETCGHDVVHADQGLLPELIAGTQAFFGGLPSGARTLEPTQIMALLWSYWMDEAVADVYGVLNMGPAFGLNLIAFFAALNAQNQPKNARKPLLRNFSGFDPNDAARRMDDHPTDLVRPYLIIGALQTMQGLPANVRDAYAAALDELAKLCSPGVTAISLAGVVELGDGSRVRINQNVPLQDMQQAAKQVGSFIASATLNALDRHSIQDIETWDDADENTAQQIAATLLKNGPIEGMGDDAQILAGATLAALQSPGLYKKITTSVNAALDLSFKQDPLWGNPRPDRAVLRIGKFSSLPIDFGVAARICIACIKDVGTVPGNILAEDPLSKFGIESDLLEELVNTIATDPRDGVPSAHFKINPNSLKIKGSTTVDELETLVINNSIPA